jgi:predicted permease
MSVGPGWRRLFRLPRRDARTIERDVDDELAFHLVMREEKLRRLGVDPSAAHAEAIVRFGDRERIRDECLTVDRQYVREVRLMEWIESVLADIRYALRSLRHAPTFAVVGALTLALGIGTSTAIFSLVDGILLRPLPYPNPQQLVRVLQSYPEKGLDTWVLSQQNVALYRDRGSDFASFAAYTPSGMTLTGDGPAERVNVVQGTGELFKTLGVMPLTGRAFGADDAQPKSPSVVVLTYGFWQSHYAGSARAIGRTIDLDGTPTRVIGVMPPGFAFPRPNVQMYVPFAIDPTRRFGWFLVGIARLKPGVSAEHAERQVTAIMWDWARANPDALSAKPIPPERTHMHGIVTPLRTALTGNIARPLVVLQAAVLLLLLIAVANIATLWSSRSTARIPEIAVRTALGATTRRVARQLVTESIVLAAIGGTLGVAFAAAAVRAFARAYAGSLPRMDEVTIDGRVLAFALLASIGSGVLFGFSPALRVARTRRLADDLAGSQKQSAHGAARRLNNTLIVAQLALSVVLLISAGLVLKSFRRLTETNLGFDPENVLSISTPLPMKKYMNNDAAAVATQAIVDRVRTLPGVRGAAAAWYLPYSGNFNTDGFLVEGHVPPANAGAETQTAQVAVTPGYFDVMRMPMRYGRDFTAADRANTLPVVVIDEAFANKFWRGADAIGKRMRFTGDTTMRTIIGVVSGIRDQDVATEGIPHTYQPYAQAPGLRPTLAVRFKGDPAPVVAEIRRAVGEIEPGAPLANIRPVADAVAQALDSRRLTELLLGGFALMALLLASVGIYGVMTLYVASREREFGIRLAIGADPARLIRLVMREGVALAVVGVLLGVAGAAVSTRWIQTLLYDVSPTDPMVFLLLAVTLLCVAAAACYTPARRAAKADPLIALRQ